MEKVRLLCSQVTKRENLKMRLDLLDQDLFKVLLAKVYESEQNEVIFTEELKRRAQHHFKDPKIKKIKTADGEEYEYVDDSEEASSENDGNKIIDEFYSNLNQFQKVLSVSNSDGDVSEEDNNRGRPKRGRPRKV